MVTRRNRDGATRAQQFVGDLDTGRRRADDQHAAVVEIVRFPVAGGHDLADARRQAGCGARNVGNVAVPGCHDRAACEPCASVGHDAVTGASLRQLHDARVVLDGRPERRCVVFEVRRDFAGRHVSVGVGARVVEPWQTRLPVRRQKPQGVPPLAAPPFGDAAALEDDVVDAGLDEVPAHREPGLTAADNDHIRTSHDLSSLAGLKARTTHGGPEGPHYCV